MGFQPRDMRVVMAQILAVLPKNEVHLRNWLEWRIRGREFEPPELQNTLNEWAGLHSRVLEAVSRNSEAVAVWNKVHTIIAGTKKPQRSKPKKSTKRKQKCRV